MKQQEEKKKTLEYLIGKGYEKLGDWGVNYEVYKKSNKRILYDVRKDEIYFKYKIDE